MTSVRVFLQLAGMMFRRGVTYRLEWLFGIFYGLLVLWVQVVVWRALLGSNTAAASASPITAGQMVTYLVVARIVAAVVNGGVARDMEGRLRSGDIVNDLLRPTGFPSMVLGRSLGQTAAGLLNRVLPVALLAHLIWGLQPPAGAAALLASVCTALIGAVVAYALAYLLGVLGFWVWTTEHFEWLVGALIQVLSGAAVPYWFLPDWLHAVAGALPFHMMGYTPVALYLGKLAPGEAAQLVAVGCAWAAGLWALAWFWWQRAVARLVIQGG